MFETIRVYSPFYEAHQPACTEIPMRRVISICYQSSDHATLTYWDGMDQQRIRLFRSANPHLNWPPMPAHSRGE